MMNTPAQRSLDSRDELQGKTFEFVSSFPSLCSPAPTWLLTIPQPFPAPPSLLPASHLVAHWGDKGVTQQSLDTLRAPSAPSSSPEELTFTWRAKCHTLGMLPATTYPLLSILGPKNLNPVSTAGKQVFPLYVHINKCVSPAWH